MVYRKFMLYQLECLIYEYYPKSNLEVMTSFKYFVTTIKKLNSYSSTCVRNIKLFYGLYPSQRILCYSYY